MPAASLPRWWRGQALNIALLLAHLFVYATQPDRENSRAFGILAAVKCVFGLAVIGFAVWLTPARVEGLRVQAHRVQPVVVAAILFVCSGLGLMLRPEWYYAHLATAVGLTGTLLYATLYADAPLTRARGWLVTGLVLVIMVYGVRAYALSVYPFIDHGDEGWALSWAADAARSGVLVSSDAMMLGMRTASTLPFYLPMGLWLRLTGIGLWEARLFSLLLSIPVIVFSGLTARRTAGTAAGWLTAFAVAASGVLASSARIRHDIGLAVCVAAALWLYVEAVHRNRPVLHLLAGAVFGMGMASHLHTVLLAPVFAIGFYVPRWVLQMRKGRIFPEASPWAFGVGGLISSGLIFILFFAPLINQNAATQSYLASQYTLTPYGILTFALRHVLNIAVHSRVEFLLVLAGLAAALVRRRPFDISLVAIFLLAHLALGVSNPVYYYIVPLTPVYGLLIGLMLSEGVRRIPQADTMLRRQAMLTACMLLPAAGLIVSGPLGYLMQGQPVRLPPPPAAQWILDHAQPDDVIISEHYYEFWLHEYRFGSVLIPVFATSDARKQYPTDESIWDSLNVDYFIFDPTLSTYGTAQRIIDSGYLDSRGYVPVAQFPGENGKTITIYGR